jgi:hypothetical protein
MGLFAYKLSCTRVNGYSTHAIADDLNYLGCPKIQGVDDCGVLGWFLMVRLDNLWAVCLKTLKLKRSEEIAYSMLSIL